MHHKFERNCQRSRLVQISLCVIPVFCVCVSTCKGWVPVPGATDVDGDGDVDVDSDADVDSDIEIQVTDPDCVTIIEKWETLEDLKAHLVAPHMLVYREKVADMVERLTLKLLEPA